MYVVNVLLALDGLPCGLTEDGAQRGRRLFPLCACQTLGANHELTLR